MFELFQGLYDIDKRGFFAFMSGRLDLTIGEGTFERYFKEYLDMADETE
ncbi:hypothetical protein J6TS7_21130 [Paenibacillus dendritiformis]|nr:hypothetical protein [Paenibacillus dendritiformis]GIO78503.1 hypothetical protein J6TS7_21130 [Paenibacillus dendritiformis]